MAVIPWRFPGGGAAIEFAKGKKADGRLKAEAKSGCLFFGPYLDVMPGRCAVRVVLERGATGPVKMELAADRGKRILAEAEFDLASADGLLVMELDLAEPTVGLEVRLFAKGKVALELIGVEIDLDRAIPDEPLSADRQVGFESRKSYADKIASGFFAKYMSGPNVMEIGYRGYEEGNLPIVPQAIGVDVGYPGYEGATFPFAGGSFDAIYSSHCFEHIGDWLGVLRDWYRLLRVGGFLVIVVPHQLLFERKRSLPSPINPDHKRFYTPKSLLGEIETAFEENSYRIRHLVENDAGFEYSIMPYQGTDGCYEIELVVEKIAKPFWHPDNGSVRAYPAGDFRTPLVKASPWEIELDLTQKNQCAVFGPYIGLDASNYIAEFHFDWAGGPVPDLVLDVALFGKRIAVAELRRGEQDYTSGKIEIPFTNPRQGEIFEFRVYVGGSVPASDAPPKFKGVVVRYAGY
jgi:SAM-dependent methyltransferase